MQFLQPAFLLGLAAAAIPIVLHFLHRRRLDRIPFAPLRFLEVTHQRQSRRLRFRRLLLLVLRVAAVVCVVLALARPTLTGGLNWLAPEGTALSVLLMVDDSASMRAQTAGGTVFDAAKAQAAAIARGLSDRDEVCIATFSDHLHPLLDDFVRDADLVLGALAERECGWRRSDTITSLGEALDWMGRASHTRREIHLIGDIQRTGIDSLAVAELALRLRGDPDLHLFLRRVEAEPFVNRRVKAIEGPATRLRPTETVELAVEVGQDGDRPLTVPLFLEVDGSKVGETESSLPPAGSARHAFAVTLPEEGELTGVVRLRPDRYPPDDQRWFVLEVTGRIDVLVLTGLPQSEPRRDPLLFVGAALDPGADGRGDFALTVQEAARLSIPSLQESAVVVALDPYELGAARLAALGDYLRGGGGMLLFLGDPRERAYANEKLLPQWTSARLGPFRGGRDGSEHLVMAAPDHPAFTGFGEEEIATLQEARLRDFYRLSEDAGRTLLRWTDGGAAVEEIEVGEGRLIVCAFHPTAASGDLPFSPMFLPLVQRLTAYLATTTGRRLAPMVEVGEPLVVTAPAGLEASARLRLRLPGERFQTVELDGQALPPRLRGGEAASPGLYTFEIDDRPWATVAVNVPSSESRRSFHDPKELKEIVARGGATRVRALEGEDVEKALERARRGRPLHRWFLLLAALLLAAESLLGRRISAGEGS